MLALVLKARQAQFCSPGHAVSIERTQSLCNLLVDLANELERHQREADRSCAGCEHFNIEGMQDAHCYAPDNWIRVPADGSGYCRHLWKVKA